MGRWGFGSGGTDVSISVETQESCIHDSSFRADLNVFKSAPPFSSPWYELLIFWVNRMHEACLIFAHDCKQTLKRGSGISRPEESHAHPDLMGFPWINRDQKPSCVLLILLEVKTWPALWKISSHSPPLLTRFSSRRSAHQMFSNMSGFLLRTQQPFHCLPTSHLPFTAI